MRPDVATLNGGQRGDIGSRLLFDLRRDLVHHLAGIVGHLVALLVHLDAKVDHFALELLALLDHL